MTQQTTTIELDAGTAKALADHAAVLGVSIQDYLKMYFTSRNDLISVDEADQWLDELVKDLPNLPPLPRDFSTKDIYSDHD
ncbi:MAG: hypothetical protein AABZ47_15515 [Planctomycetota bacterium]